MYIEYACYNKIRTSDVKSSVFSAIEEGVKGISIPLTFLSKISHYMPDGIIVSCPIDYPNGFGDTDIRIHYTLRAINYGANTIDIMVNTFLYYHSKDNFLKDLSSLIDLCKDKKVIPRIMIDYKKLVNPEDFLPMLRLISSLKVDYIFCSNGLFSEDPIDNIITCKIAQDSFGFKAISNGNFYLPEHFHKARNSHIFGARFNNCTALKRCVSVYNKKEDKDI